MPVSAPSVPEVRLSGSGETPHSVGRNGLIKCTRNASVEVMSPVIGAGITLSGSTILPAGTESEPLVSEITPGPTLNEVMTNGASVPMVRLPESKKRLNGPGLSTGSATALPESASEIRDATIRLNFLIGTPPGVSKRRKLIAVPSRAGRRNENSSSCAGGTLKERRAVLQPRALVVGDRKLCNLSGTARRPHRG